MNKICGYNCEHNKGGQCQITYCDKIGEMTTTTQWLSGGRQQGKTYQLIKDQQKEIERLSKEVTKYDEILCERNNEVDRLNNIINELEKWIMEDVKDEKPDLFFQVLRKIDILDKLEKLKEGK